MKIKDNIVVIRLVQHTQSMNAVPLYATYNYLLVGSVFSYNLNCTS